MERTLFDWKEWDELETGMFQFYNVTLKIPIGGFATDTHFEAATVDYNEGFLQFYNDEVVVGEYRLCLEII